MEISIAEYLPNHRKWEGELDLDWDIGTTLRIDRCLLVLFQSLVQHRNCHDAILVANSISQQIVNQRESSLPHHLGRWLGLLILENHERARPYLCVSSCGDLGCPL